MWQPGRLPTWEDASTGEEELTSPTHPVNEGYESRPDNVKFDHHLDGEYDAAIQEGV